MLENYSGNRNKLQMHPFFVNIKANQVCYLGCCCQANSLPHSACSTRKNSLKRHSRVWCEALLPNHGNTPPPLPMPLVAVDTEQTTLNPPEVLHKKHH